MRIGAIGSAWDRAFEGTPNRTGMYYTSDDNLPISFIRQKKARNQNTVKSEKINSKRSKNNPVKGAVLEPQNT